MRLVQVCQRPPVISLLMLDWTACEAARPLARPKDEIQRLTLPWVAGRLAARGPRLPHKTRSRQPLQAGGGIRVGVAASQPSPAVGARAVTGARDASVI